MDMPKETCLIFIDVKKAHFWSPARRRLLVGLPPEAGYPSDKVGLVKKLAYTFMKDFKFDARFTETTLQP